MQDRPRKPLSCPHQTAPDIVAALLDARRLHPTWGAKKLLKLLTKRDPDRNWPARSTVCDLRPHEALSLETPASVYQPSPRPFPEKLPALEYPAHDETRYVSYNGGIRWNSDWVNVSITCAGEYVGLEEIDNGIWNVYFGPVKLGRLIEEQMRIEDAFGQLCRHKKKLYPMCLDFFVTHFPGYSHIQNILCQIANSQ